MGKRNHYAMGSSIHRASSFVEPRTPVIHGRECQVVKWARETLDECVVGNGFDEPRTASSCETSTRPAAVRANEPIKAAQSPISGALPALLVRQAHWFLHFFLLQPPHIGEPGMAISDSVMCRYHLYPKRTSYSSSPVSPLASSVHYLDPIAARCSPH